MDMSNFLVSKCPPTVMYIPNFITSEEEQCILANIEKTPKPKWTQLLNRRLINYGGIPHPNGMVALEIPEWLQTYVDKINNLNILETKKANHVLVNEYLPGQGIMPHTDGPLFSPTISTISCGSHTILELTKRDTSEIKPGNSEDSSVILTKRKEILYKLIVEPRSLLILKDSIYSNYLHSIGEVDNDVLCDRVCNYENCEKTYKMGDCLKRGTRISLTIRNVPKATKMKLQFR